MNVLLTIIVLRIAEIAYADVARELVAMASVASSRRELSCDLSSHGFHLLFDDRGSKK